MSTVLVTGAAGYIGGQTMLRLKDAGHTVIAVDRRPLPEHLAHVADQFMQQDFASDDALLLINQHQATAVVHCAGTSLVGPSMKDPEPYYDNNFVKTKRLADHVMKFGLPCRIIYSSSAAVYGEPVFTPCHEEDPAQPISPYGQSKYMTEMMLTAYHVAHGLDHVIFRYFNACGADSQGRHGQEPGATHIIARVLESIRNNSEFQLYGDGYDTPDGTCVRDYLHVQDIVDAHIRALERDVGAGVYNLGTSTGTSNREIMDMAQRITGRELRYRVVAPRLGDPGILTASSARWQSTSQHQFQWSLDNIIEHAWTWYQT